MLDCGQTLGFSSVSYKGIVNNGLYLHQKGLMNLLVLMDVTGRGGNRKDRRLQILELVKWNQLDPLDLLKES